MLQLNSYIHTPKNISQKNNLIEVFKSIDIFRMSFNKVSNCTCIMYFKND